MSEPYTLISEAPRYSYFIFEKASKSIQDLNKETKNIVVFGRANFDKETLKILHKKLKIKHIEYLPDKIIATHGPDGNYDTIKIIAE